MRRWLAVAVGVLAALASLVAGRARTIYCVTTPCLQPGDLVWPGLLALLIAAAAIPLIVRRGAGLAADLGALAAGLAGCRADRGPDLRRWLTGSTTADDPGHGPSRRRPEGRLHRATALTYG